MKTLQHIALLFFISLCVSGWKGQAQASKASQDKRTSVEMVTNYGTIILELYNETPLHRDNFIKLIKEKAYDNLLFHRVIKEFMIQGGDPDSRHALTNAMLGDGDLGYTIKAEFHPDLFHHKGALATAREDNQSRASSGIQFFIVQGKVYNDSLLDVAEDKINSRLARYHVINDVAYTNLWDSLQKAIKDKNDDKYSLYNDRIDSISKTYDNFEKYVMPESHRAVYKTIGGTPQLDENYTVFGQVIKGLEVVDSIAATKTNKNDRPIEDVRILSIKLLN